MTSTQQKKIRVTEERWQRLETEAASCETTPNRLLVELAFEVLEPRQWPRTEVEIHLLRSSMFAAQAISRYMIKAGLQDDVAEISHNISEIAPNRRPGSPPIRSIDFFAGR